MKLSKKLQAESQSEKNMYQKMLGQKPSAKVDKNSQNSSSMVRNQVWAKIYRMGLKNKIFPAPMLLTVSYSRKFVSKQISRNYCV